jgi:hypothetical protein
MVKLSSFQVEDMGSIPIIRYVYVSRNISYKMLFILQNKNTGVFCYLYAPSTLHTKLLRHKFISLNKTLHWGLCNVSLSLHIFLPQIHSKNRYCSLAMQELLYKVNLFTEQNRYNKRKKNKYKNKYE